MTPEPSISVIIPVKNRAELLKATLNNILQQTLSPSEIIVVDDGSTDHLPEVKDQFQHQVQFVENPGKGPGAARNLGLKLASGKYIQFFDSDDLMTRDKLCLQADALEKTEADMAYGPYVQAFEASFGVWEQRDVVMQQGALPTNKNLTAVLLLGWNCITQSCLFRKEFLEKAPPWNEQLITHEDYLYLFNLSLNKPRLVHTPGAGVIYRMHGAQSTENNTNSLSRSADKLAVLQHMEHTLNRLDPTFYQRWNFYGRCYLTASHFVAQGGDEKLTLNFLSKKHRLASYLYRWHNKLERKATGTNWETMHGVGKNTNDFNLLVSAV